MRRRRRIIRRAGGGGGGGGGGGLKEEHEDGRRRAKVKNKNVAMKGDNKMFYENIMNEYKKVVNLLRFAFVWL